MTSQTQKRLETLDKIVKANFAMISKPAFQRADDCKIKQVDSFDMPSMTAVAMFCYLASDGMGIAKFDIARYIGIYVPQVAECLEKHVKLQDNQIYNKRYRLKLGLVLNGLKLDGEKI